MAENTALDMPGDFFAPCLPSPSKTGVRDMPEDTPRGFSRGLHAQRGSRAACMRGAMETGAGDR